MQGTPPVWESYRKAVTVGGVVTYEVEAYRRDGKTFARSRTLGDDGTFEWTELERVGRRFLRKEGLV